MTKQTTKHRIGTGAGWLTAWLELPKIEKELTRRKAKSAQQSQRRDICAQNALQAQQ